MGQALGRDAVYGDCEAPDDRGASAATPTKGPRWDETHSRATYHLPLEIQRRVDQEAKRSGRSKSKVVADLLAQHLPG
jgi:hypothetical protein